MRQHASATSVEVVLRSTAQSVLLSVRVATAANPGGADPSIAGNAAYFNALMIYLVPHSLVTVSLLTALGTTIGLPLPVDGPTHRRGVVGLADLDVPESSPVRRRSLFGLTPEGV